MHPRIVLSSYLWTDYTCKPIRVPICTVCTWFYYGRLLFYESNHLIAILGYNIYRLFFLPYMGKHPQGKTFAFQWKIAICGKTYSLQQFCRLIIIADRQGYNSQEKILRLSEKLQKFSHISLRYLVTVTCLCILNMTYVHIYTKDKFTIQDMSVYQLQVCNWQEILMN